MSLSGDDVILLEDLLHCLLECSEKASRIARTFRRQDDLFGLLVEEKAEIQKSRMVIHDFKTLADVLVQETIKRDVGQKFPALSSKIQGEEQNSFQNTLGESIKVELTDSEEETSDLLCKVLNGKVHIAEALANIVHSGDVIFDRECSSPVTVPADSLGIWIDPIDSTAEYIQAKRNNSDENGIESRGLKCVCVLIGVYDLQTGIPIMGIINQPFYKDSETDSKWESNIYWGISYNCEMKTSASIRNKAEEKRKVVVTSCFENPELQSIMQTKYSVVHVAGAGYKCLVVAEKKADLYVISLQNTHFWDTCGPHAILAAQGGGIVSFKQIINTNGIVDHSNIQNYQLKYLDDTANPKAANTEGLIAYRDLKDLIEFLELLHENGYETK